MSELKAGDQVYISGIYDGQWARSGNGTWLEAGDVTLGDGCAAPALFVSDPGPRPVRVTFRVNVPDSTTDDVFLSGYFKGTEYPVWVPYMVLLIRESEGTWSISLDLPVGTEVAYVYTRSSWESIERPASCGGTDSRHLTVSDDAEVVQEDMVVKWRDLDCE